MLIEVMLVRRVMVIMQIYFHRLYHKYFEKNHELHCPARSNSEKLYNCAIEVGKVSIFLPTLSLHDIDTHAMLFAAPPPHS